MREEEDAAGHFQEDREVNDAREVVIVKRSVEPSTRYRTAFLTSRRNPVWAREGPRPLEHLNMHSF